MKIQKAKIGIIGCGEMGLNHYKCIKKLSDLFELVFICDTSDERLARITDCIIKYSDWNILRYDIEDKRLECDGIIIATPSELHFTMAATLSPYSKILVEKPVCLRYEDTDRLNKNVMAGHTMVYHPVIEHIKNSFEHNDFIPVKFYLRRWNRGKPTRESVLWRLAPHDISIFLYLTRDLWNDVPYEKAILHSISTTLIHRESWEKNSLIWNDSLDFSLKYGEDRYCNISVSREAQITDRTLTIIGDDYNGNYKVYRFDETNKLYSEYLNGEKLSISYKDFEYKEDPLTEELRSFYSFIIYNTVPRTNNDHFIQVGAILQDVEDEIERLKLKNKISERRVWEFE